MKQLFWLSGFFLAVSLSAAAQDTPRFETFGGYSYFHQSFAGTGFNFNGGSGSITGNFTPLFGITGDFGVYHNNTSGVSSTNFTYLFGPKFAYRGNERVTPYFHVLLGGVHESSSFAGVSASSNAFAAGFGGGLDVKVSPHVAIRVAQVDYLLTKFQDDEDNRQNNVRISAGIVFRWGGTSSKK